MKYLFLIMIFMSLNAFGKAEIPFEIQHAMDVIEANFGDKVKLKPKTLFKFGHNHAVGSSGFTTLMDLPTGILNETYVSTNLINKVSSSSAADTQQVVIEGHKLVGSNFVFVSQIITLVGQTETELTTPLVRVSRLYNNGSTDFAGQIYVYQDDTVTAGVPDTDAKVHIIVDSGTYNQSTKASTTMSGTDYYIITQALVSINSKNSAHIIEAQIQVRMYGKVFRTVGTTSASVGGSNTVEVAFSPPIIVPKNADVRMRAEASAAGVNVSAWMNGYLAEVKQ